ncbi:MAG: ComF family protein [Flavobacteriales bacterium]
MLIDLIKIGFPKNCLSCSNALVQNENYLCSSCYFYLPKGELAIHNETDSGKLFEPLDSFVGAGHLFNFDKNGKTQQVLHELKYNSNQDFGVYLGKLFGNEFFNILTHIDLIVPVPLHPKKQHQRGFNQSELLARGISDVTNINISTNNLIRNRFTETQTKKNKSERKKNIAMAFEIINKLEFENKRIVILDDVITTGSTLSECIKVLSQVQGIEISGLLLAKANF